MCVNKVFKLILREVISFSGIMEICSVKNMKKVLEMPIKKGNDVFIAPNATVIGDVSLGNNCSIWFGAVLRGDNDTIVIGEGTNIQENAVLHVDPGAPVEIGKDCIIGHCAIVHGAKIANNVLIGMHATILNHASIGDFCIVGANALVTAGTTIPPFSMVLGSPAKIIRPLTENEIEAVKQNAAVYIEKGKEYLTFYNSKGL